jgi:hypothetical protein
MKSNEKEIIESSGGSEIAREIVKNIVDGKLDSARDSISRGLQQSSADAIDMKRIDMQIDWINKK